MNRARNVEIRNATEFAVVVCPADEVDRALAITIRTSSDAAHA